jgi:hypothetical protein
MRQAAPVIMRIIDRVLIAAEVADESGAAGNTFLGVWGSLRSGSLDGGDGDIARLY